MEEYMKVIAGMMAVAARTAPKTKGEDYISIKILEKNILSRLADEMIEYGKLKSINGFMRDGENVRNTDAVLLISLSEATEVGLNCGACGFETCGKMDENKRKGPEFNGPICTWRIVDLGIALGSAAKSASLLNADNRIMYRIGVAALRANMIKGEVALGIPISATGKNIYFDR